MRPPKAPATAAKPNQCAIYNNEVRNVGVLKSDETYSEAQFLLRVPKSCRRTIWNVSMAGGIEWTYTDRAVLLDQIQTQRHQEIPVPS
jgi:hypothetical protein